MLGPVLLQQGGVPGGGSGQGAQAGVGGAPGAGLVQAPGQQERGDSGGGLQVDAAARAAGQLLPEGALLPVAVQGEHGVGGPAAGGGDAERDKGVHGGRSVPGGAQRRPVEWPRAPQDHRGRAADQDPLPAREPRRGQHRQDQGQVGQRDEEHQRDDQATAQPREVAGGPVTVRQLAAWGIAGVAPVAGLARVIGLRVTGLGGSGVQAGRGPRERDPDDGIARPGDRGGQFLRGQRGRSGDQGGPGRVVHRGGHAGEAGQLLVDPGRARGAGHPLNDQGHLAHGARMPRVRQRGARQRDHLTSRVAFHDLVVRGRGGKVPPSPRTS